jgi:hypothetical protein
MRLFFASLYLITAASAHQGRVGQDAANDSLDERDAGDQTMRWHRLRTRRRDRTQRTERPVLGAMEERAYLGDPVHLIPLVLGVSELSSRAVARWLPTAQAVPLRSGTLGDSTASASHLSVSGPASWFTLGEGHQASNHGRSTGAETMPTRKLEALWDRGRARSLAHDGSFLLPRPIAFTRPSQVVISLIFAI